MDTAGAELPTPPAATPTQSSSCDRVYAPSFVAGHGMAILDAHTSRQLGVAGDPCDARPSTSLVTHITTTPE